MRLATQLAALSAHSSLAHSPLGTQESSGVPAGKTAKDHIDFGQILNESDPGLKAEFEAAMGQFTVQPKTAEGATEEQPASQAEASVADGSGYAANSAHAPATGGSAFELSIQVPASPTISPSKAAAKPAVANEAGETKSSGRKVHESSINATAILSLAHPIQPVPVDSALPPVSLAITGATSVLPELPSSSGEAVHVANSFPKVMGSPTDKSQVVRPKGGSAIPASEAATDADGNLKVDSGMDRVPLEGAAITETTVNLERTEPVPVDAKPVPADGAIASGPAKSSSASEVSSGRSDIGGTVNDPASAPATSSMEAGVPGETRNTASAMAQSGKGQRVAAVPSAPGAPLSPSSFGATHGLYRGQPDGGTATQGLPRTLNVAAAAVNPYQKLDQGTAPTVLRAGTDRMAVGIHDPALGWVEIKTQSSAGVISASIATASSQTHQSLAAQLPSLAQFMSEREVKVGSLTVEQQLAGGGERAASGDSHTNPQQRGEEPASGLPAGPMSASVGFDMEEISQERPLSYISVRA